MKKRLVLGRIDKIDLPDLGLEDIEVKIDSGARTSSMHCDEISEIEVEGKKLLHFVLHNPEHDPEGLKSYTLDNYKLRKVKSSTGISRKRYVIETRVKIFDREFLTEFTLADRKKMKFPILLGRRLLFKNFIVDVSKSNLSYKNKYDKE